MQNIILKPKYFLYARKSTEDDNHQIMSIEAQLFELREYARRENVEILQEFTESKSAKKPGRELFAEMITKIEASEGVGILAWHPDRLARNSVDGGKVIYLVDTQKIVSLRFPTFWFEPTPQGNLVLKLGTERHLPKRPSTGCSLIVPISVLWRTKANTLTDALSQFFPSQPLKPCKKS